MKSMPDDVVRLVGFGKKNNHLKCHSSYKFQSCRHFICVFIIQTHFSVAVNQPYHAFKGNTAVYVSFWCATSHSLQTLLLTAPDHWNTHVAPPITIRRVEMKTYWKTGQTIESEFPCPPECVKAGENICTIWRATERHERLCVQMIPPWLLKLLEMVFRGKRPG